MADATNVFKLIELASIVHERFGKIGVNADNVILPVMLNEAAMLHNSIATQNQRIDDAIRHYNREEKELREKVDRLVEEKESLTQRNTDLAKSNVDLIDKNEAAQQALKVAQNDAEAMGKQIGVLNDDILRSRERNANLEKANKSLSEALEKARQENSELREKIYPRRDI